MTPTAQHIALLEWLGWKFSDDGWCEHVEGGASFRSPPPLTLDLMREAEERLSLEQRKEYAEKHLYALLPNDENHGPCGDGDMDIMTPSYFAVCHATKECRLEALLRTLNLWKEPNQ